MSIQGSRKRKADGSWEKVSTVLLEAPRELHVEQYAESHAAEIQVLSKKVADVGANKNIAQKIPIHMRRRAMSHNVKRLPHSIQQKATHLVGDKIRKTSRFHRRRPKNLRDEYNRRKRKHVWLETHIWHAKRFHMIEKWGFKIPWKPTMKSERACYRATSKHCLLQDKSFMCCVELQGEEKNLLEGLKHITHIDTGQTFAAVSCLKGTREGQTIVYKYDKYPWNAIGPVSFMWNPVQPISSDQNLKSTNQRQLWIWCHPGCFEDIWNELLVCLELKEGRISIQNVEGIFKAVNVEDAKNTEFNKINESDEEPYQEKFKSNTIAINDSQNLSMKSLTGSLLRFSLTGPQSVAVIVDTIVQANIVPASGNDDTKAWWKSYYGDEKLSLGYVAQREFLESLAQCQTPSELPRYSVIAMTTRDPRLSRPTTRTKIVANDSTLCQDKTSFNEKLTEEVSISPLWHEGIRDNVYKTMSTDYQVYEMKSELLVPGLPLELGDKESRIPVIIIQRPGVTSLVKSLGSDQTAGQGEGLDIILPKGWGMAFWLALVYRGARVGGLREEECNAFEERRVIFPNNLPDTKSGERHELDLEQEKVNKYNKIPPAKRPNFTKVGVNSPYRCPWNLLMKYWSNQTLSESIMDGNNCINGKDSQMAMVTDLADENGVKNSDINSQFYVLRNVKSLRHLQRLCSLDFSNKRSHITKMPTNVDLLKTLEMNHSQSLVAVKVEMVQKGCPGEFSSICIPKEEDMQRLMLDKNYGGPVETPHKDPVLIEKQKLKRDMKEKGIRTKVKIDRSLKLLSEKDCEYFQIGSRDMIGYLCSGGFSLGVGNGGGVGFVATIGLMKLLKLCENVSQNCVVLVRGNSSLQFRFAKLSVIL
ncbi:Ribonucleases P/MRP protein subunit pop1 [Mactra antiquata]